MSLQHSSSLKIDHMAAKSFLLLNFYKYLYWKAIDGNDTLQGMVQISIYVLGYTLE